ncbi:MAG: sugar-binding protein [Selenomonadaceae bacterium]|nr:sugar-binding protein [Selenomonadaceae bacterium]
MKLAKIFCAMMLAVFAAALSGCGSSALSLDNSVRKSVAVCFPNLTPSWQRNGAAMQQLLEEEGFTVDIYYTGKAEEQAEQLRSAIAKKPGCIVIGALGTDDQYVDVLAEAKKLKVPVIAFDRVITSSDAVSYYASFDNGAIGEGMGEYLETALGLKSGSGPYNIELFAGGQDDNNAHVFFEKTMAVLEPYFRSGQLVCRSGQTTFDKVYVADWVSENARPRIKQLLSQYYTDTPLQVVLSPNDDIAGVILSEFSAAGKPAPVISGLDGDPAAYQRIREGTQTFTIAKDANVLTAKCVRMIKAVVEGTQPDINDVTTYKNGDRVIPAYLCTPQIVDKTNVDIVAK